MKKNIIKYIILIAGIFASIIIYLTFIGVETKKFNNQIKDKVAQTNSKLDLKLKKIKLTLDPVNFKINAKTVGAKIVYQKKILELEYIKTQISLKSLTKNKFISSSLKVSTRSILLKDLVTFAKEISNKPELIFLEHFIKKGHVILDMEINFDKNGKIKKDYLINGSLKNGKINLIKNYNFEKIDFFFDVRDNILNFKDISFTTNKINFFSDNLKATKSEKDFIFEGKITNKNSSLSKELLNLLKIKFKNLDFALIDFNSKNNFTFKINNNFKLKDLIVESEIQINKSHFKKPVMFNNYLPEIGEITYLKDHLIRLKYKEDNLSVQGSGKIKLEKEFDKIDYLFNKIDQDISLISNIAFSELNIKSQKFLKNFFPEINKKIILKKHQVKVKFKKDYLSLVGSGKIQLGKEIDKIDYSFSKIDDKFKFDTKLELDKTLLKIDYLNFTKNKKLKSLLTVIGDYQKKRGLNLYEASITEKENKIKFNNISLDHQNKIIKVDKVYFDYIDSENKNNELILKRMKENNYELSGSIFNASNLISNLLEDKSERKSKIFKNDIKLNISLNEVFIDDKNLIKDIKGKLKIVDSEIISSNISAFFNDNTNLIFTINTNNDEKITTLFSSKAKPFVGRYKFIKGFEEGDLNFYSLKKNGISNSVLVIDNFKVQKIPILAKLLTLASLQGIADLLTGEGIRFTDFEMKFSNNKNVMTIEELYAIGPSISILLDGYIQSNELISLRGTLVPASTINRTIASIPFVGDLLVGKKVGEGIFGVSFKVKGSPKDLKTSVNPIKTLTPRFITRTLEKIKKN